MHNYCGGAYFTLNLLRNATLLPSEKFVPKCSFPFTNFLFVQLICLLFACVWHVANKATVRRNKQTSEKSRKIA